MESTKDSKKKKTYTKPQLVVRGNIDKITLTTTSEPFGPFSTS